jgi:hypothetical protein
MVFPCNKREDVSWSSTHPPQPNLLQVGGKERVFFSNLCLACRVWTVLCSLSTWTGDSRLSMQVFGRGVFKEGTPDMFANSTSLLSHMLWQMLSSFHLYMSAKGKKFYTFQVEPSGLGSFHSVSSFLSDGSIKLAHCKKKI